MRIDSKKHELAIAVVALCAVALSIHFAIQWLFNLFL
jgi:hypothetical protein